MRWKVGELAQGNRHRLDLDEDENLAYRTRSATPNTVSLHPISLATHPVTMQLSAARPMAKAFAGARVAPTSNGTRTTMKVGNW